MPTDDFFRRRRYTSAVPPHLQRRPSRRPPPVPVCQPPQLPKMDMDAALAELQARLDAMQRALAPKKRGIRGPVRARGG
jgi:hypothetical protein